MRYELEQAHDHMELLSLKDPLTGAWNRRFLDQKFNEIISGFCDKNLPVYFATIDINDFKLLNDRFGHDFGDLVLKQLVKHYLHAFSENEHLVRMGGDEFAILMTSSNPQQVLTTAADELRTDPVLFSASTESQVTLSIGIMQIDCQNTLSLEQIYSKADKVLYKAKEKKQYTSEATIEFKSVR